VHDPVRSDPVLGKVPRATTADSFVLPVSDSADPAKSAIEMDEANRRNIPVYTGGPHAPPHRQPLVGQGLHRDLRHSQNLDQTNGFRWKGNHRHYGPEASREIAINLDQSLWGEGDWHE